MFILFIYKSNILNIITSDLTTMKITKQSTSPMKQKILKTNTTNIYIY